MIEPNITELKTNIEKALTDFLREKLNENTFDIQFAFGFWVYKDETFGDYTEETIEPEGHIDYEENRNIVPCAIEYYNGDILALEGIFDAEYSLPMSFQINSDEQYYIIQATNAIDEVKNKLRGQVFQIDVPYTDEDDNEQTETFTMVTQTSNLTPMGNTQTQKGTTYSFGSITFDFTISKTAVFGNQFQVYMREHGYPEDSSEPRDYVRLYPLDPTSTRENTLEPFQSFGTNETSHEVQESSYSNSITMIVENKDLHFTLLKDIMKKDFLSRRFDIKIDVFRHLDDEEPDFTFEDVIVLSTGEAVYSIGEEAVITFGYVKAFKRDY